MIDQAAIDRLKRETDLVALIGRSVKWTRRKGDDYWASCPLHKGDNTASFKVSNQTGHFFCFACQAGGDCFDWIRRTENCSFADAVERLSNGHAAPFAPQQVDALVKKKKATPVPVFPVPDSAPAADFHHRDHPGEPIAVWAYRNAAGQLLGYTARFNTADGGKEICPRVWTEKGWRWAGFPRPRPLYGLDKLAARPDAPVIIFEGEKKADCCDELAPNYVGVSWNGGTGNVQHTDWEPLKGRECLLWADNDDVGRNAMRSIAKILGAGRLIEIPDGKPKGWDIADALAEGWDTARVSALLAPPHEPEPVEARGPVPADVPPEVAPELPTEPPEFDPADTAGEWPFATLGHRQGIYFYLPFDGGTVITLSGASHTKSNFMMLAPLQFWEMKFGVRDRAGWDSAANALIQQQHRKGVFDPTLLRGRGAWWDDKRVVVHLGNRLLVNGASMPVRELRTDYIYEVGAKIRHAEVTPLTNPQAHRLIDLCKLLSWERPVSAYLLAGWCALAPICGALTWRPHLAIGGPASAGKSWIMSKIIAPSLGQFALALASTVTEPGIRRALGFDARPVIVDEFEAKDDFARARLEAIMGLMRYSSSETDAMIVKGSNSGVGVEFFKIRSMFCTAAIGSLINDYADKTRISVLGLKLLTGRAGADKFAEIEAKQRATMTEAWVDGLHARIMGMIPIIRLNAATFAAAGAEVIGTRRLGDQLGTLIAGAYALTSRQVITQEAAEAWLQQQDWSEEKEIIQDTDGPLCYARIMEHQVMCEARQGGSVRRSLGDLVQMVFKKSGDELVAKEAAIGILRRHGLIALDDGGVAVSNTHSALREILYDTPWAANWNLRLKSIAGAEPSKKTLSFGSGAAAKAVVVPHSAE